MTGSSDDIQEYLNIIEGNFPKNEQINENTSINLGVSTAGAVIGQSYLFENGLRWATLKEEDENHWLIEHGFLEYEADSEEYISKHNMSVMIRSGEMTLMENAYTEETILEESLTLEDDGFEDFMDGVERYLLVNEGRESFDFEYNWSDAWSEGKTPLESAEEAILLED